MSINLTENPVGSIDEKLYTITGTGGSVRHRGYFSPDNHEVKQALVAATNQDKDAAFERAILWESNRQILEEQRAYEDPSAKLARERAAGINPDLVGGSSGSGGTLSGSSAQMTPVQGQIPFSNKYQNLQLAFEGINSAASLLSSLSGIASTVGNLHQMATMLPAQERIANSEAYVAEHAQNARVDIANATADGAKLSNLQAGLNFTSQLAGWITPDMSQEDASSIMSAVGIDPSQHKQYFDNVQTYHKNPSLQASVAEGKLAAKTAAAKNEAFTNDRLFHMYENIAQAEELSSWGNFYKANIDKDVAELLASSNYAQNTALGTIGSSANVLISNDVSSASLELALQKYSYDVKAFARQIEYIAELKRNIQFDIDNIDLSKIDFPSDAAKDAYKASLLEKQRFLDIVGTYQFNQLRDVFRSLEQSKYLLRDTHLGEDGGMIGYDSRAEFANVTFGGISTNPYLFREFVNFGLGLATHGLTNFKP